MDQDTGTGFLTFLKTVRPVPLVAGFILWLLYWDAAAPAPDATGAAHILTFAAGALCFGCAVTASGLTGERFKVFGICVHIMLGLTACFALNNGSVAVGLYILLGQGALFGGSALVRMGLPGIRPTHGGF